MIRKLKAYNFSKQSLTLLRSYFEKRLGRVNLGTATSDWKKIKKGCLQGSCFGPLLWNIFQNDLFFSINYCQLSMYADDHQFYSSGTRVSDVERILNDQAQVAANWYSDDKLLANKEMFQAMVVTKKKGQDIPKIYLKVDNEEIEQTTCLKLLGVTIDHQLFFSEHVLKDISVKSSQKIGVLLRMKNLTPEKAKLHIFKTNILPHLTYCSVVDSLSSLFPCYVGDRDLKKPRWQQQRKRRLII